MRLLPDRVSIIQVLSFTLVVGFASACAVTEDDPQPTTTMTEDEVRTADHIGVCANGADEVRCHARVLVDALGAPRANAAPPPSSFNAAQLRSFYGITGAGSTATTVAIVDANGYPRALTDLQQYRSMNGLPSIVACTPGGSRPCLAVVNQGCTVPLPAFDLGWAQETALDLDMVSAMCPNCNILLVQGSSATFANLATAENTASTCLTTGTTPVAISNSYGAVETGTTSFASAYNHPGITITVSSGDGGFAGGTQFPASAPTVLAVGGTSIFPGATPREKAWVGAGSGCSALYAKPAWQLDTGCPRRMVADVSAVADPNTGVVVVAPTSVTANGLFVFGGTSVSAPLIAGIIGNVGSAISPSKPYANTPSLFGVTVGNNGTCASQPPYFCNAVVGYDGPTGLGSPIGPVAF
jgi:subtilase family serine protease